MVHSGRTPLDATHKQELCCSILNSPVVNMCLLLLMNFSSLFPRLTFLSGESKSTNFHVAVTGFCCQTSDVFCLIKVKVKNKVALIYFILKVSKIAIK